jgi:histidine phosphotransferase ChpT
MRVTVDLRVLELLSARLCHELVSPVAAINNGVELLGEEDPDFVRDAVELIGQSAQKAGRRLQFYRFAYGTSGSAAGIDPKALVEGLLDDGKITCDWPSEAMTLPQDWQRLACNIVVMATECLPRGGAIAVRPKRAGVSGVEVIATGDTVNVTPEMRAAVAPNAVVDDLTSRTVQSYFSGRLAERLGAQLAVAQVTPGQAALTAIAGPRQPL